ncbi:hypothetical protein JOF56_000778 [Kibdelosporangium banguiense]|uniref:Uncharacterized protein n=1 Tax=Kibdelosporangium banguiense TaxID=1365924 RepID=A0ABS4T969_9PSEU|nr:hypothetical protein [Kibdelosporangium banguiense]
MNAAPKNQTQQLHANGGAKTKSDKDVNCSTKGGKVGPQHVDLIAVQTDAGVVGCTEAFNVITEYFAKAPHGEGPGRRVLDIQGSWSCAKAPEPEGSKGVVYCGEQGPDGRAIETAPAK